MLARLRRFDDAMEHYRGAIEIKPDYAAAHHGLAVILSSKGQFEEAIKHYTEAVKFAPDYAQAHVDYAAALYFSGDFARAWEQLAAARKYGAQVDPEFVKALSEKMPEPK
jgi:tetratricopeptide (TPR) repeat protein